MAVLDSIFLRPRARRYMNVVWGAGSRENGIQYGHKQSWCPYDELQPRLCLCSLGLQCQGRQNLKTLGVADSPSSQQERHYSHLLLGGKTMVCMLPKGAFAHGGDLVVVKAPPSARRLILHVRHCTHTLYSLAQLYFQHSTMLLACHSSLCLSCQSSRQPQTWTTQTQLNICIPASPHTLQALAEP